MLRLVYFVLLSQWLVWLPAKSLAGCLEIAEDYAIADLLKAVMGIREGFATDFRVERKSTNLTAEASAFRSFVLTGIPYKSAESGLAAAEVPPYVRDKPNAGMTNVTSTIYPFSRELQSWLDTRIRVRMYGERPLQDGGTAEVRPTGGEFISLEIKAKTAEPGVVVKPILKIRPETLPSLFSDYTTFVSQREALLGELRLTNKDQPEGVAAAVLDVVETFHHYNERLFGNRRVDAAAVEYEREAYVSEVVDQSTGQRYKIQMTFDRAVNMRVGVDPRLSPYANRSVPVAYRYPESGLEALVVTEMKSPVELNRLFLESPSYVQTNIPSYYAMRMRYEALQARQAPGFAADSGKAKQIQSLGREVDGSPRIFED